MIIVTGTKRSGTSMWMQILRAAGYPVLGEPFLGNWKATIEAANPQGFYESPLRHGIYYATNPDPETGIYLSPGETRGAAIKVFPAGLAKSDLAYVEKVVASIRSFREYERSLARLYALEYENNRALAERAGRPVETVPKLSYAPPALEWWSENYTLLRDALLRRYPLHMVSYAAVLRAPKRSVSEALAWLGGGDVVAGTAAVADSLRSQQGEPAEGAEPSGVSPDHAALFDELYARVDTRTPLDQPFIDRLNAAQDELEPRILAAERTTREQRRRERARARAAGQA